MDHPLIDIINARVEKAEKDGAFDDLEGAGKPIPDLNDPNADYLSRVMRENGILPEFVLLMNQISDLREKLRETADRTERKQLMAEIAVLESRAAAAREAWVK